LGAPIFYSDQQYFIVTLKNKNFGKTKVLEEIVVQKSSEITSQNKNVTTVAIARLIGVSTRAIEKQIAKLKENGTLKRVGGDKGGHWEIDILILKPV